MDSVISIEERRIALQKKLDNGKTPKERNRLGQFSTPTSLASDILAYAHTLLPERVPVRFLDPALGTGSSIPPCCEISLPSELRRRPE